MKLLFTLLLWVSLAPLAFATKGQPKPVIQLAKPVKLSIVNGQVVVVHKRRIPGMFNAATYPLRHGKKDLRAVKRILW